jgi:hypothetical protein
MNELFNAVLEYILCVDADALVISEKQQDIGPSLLLLNLQSAGRQREGRSH